MVLVLTVAAALRAELPAVVFQQADHLAELHGLHRAEVVGQTFALATQASDSAGAPMRGSWFAYLARRALIGRWDHIWRGAHH